MEMTFSAWFNRRVSALINSVSNNGKKCTEYFGERGGCQMNWGSVHDVLETGVFIFVVSSHDQHSKSSRDADLSTTNHGIPDPLSHFR